MTVTTPSSGPARRRAGARAIAVISAILLMLSPAAPALAATTPTPSPTPGTVELSVAPLGNGVLRPGSALNIAVALRNTTDEVAPAASADIALGSSPLTSPAAVSAWLSGSADLPVESVATAALPATEGGSDSVSAVSVPAADPRIAALAPGIYPLRAASGSFEAVSVVVVPRPDAASIPVGVIVPITAPPRSSALIGSDELAELTAPDGALTSQLDGVTGTPAILAVDPAIVASIRVLGTSAPASARMWLDRLLSLDNERFALQFGDADVAVQLAAGLSKPLQPLSLQRYLRDADFPPAPPTPGPSPEGTATTPSPSPTDGPSFPSLDALLDIGPATPDVFWPTPGTAGPATLAAIAKLADADLATTTLLPSDAVSDVAPSARSRSDGAGLLVYDETASAALTAAAGLDDPTLRSARLAAASAELWFATGMTGGAPLLVALDRDPERSRVGLRTAIGAATGGLGTTAIELSDLLAMTPRAVAVKDAAPDAERVSAASALLSDEDRVTAFATILDAPVLLTGPQRAQDLQVLGVPWTSDPDGWRAAFADARARTETVLDSVDIVQPSSLNLISSGAGLPFWVRNDLPFPVDVVLYTTSDDLRLDVQEATVVTAQPRSNTSVEVPVRARVGSGDVILELQLRSPTSQPIGTVKHVAVSVRAEWETIGGVVLGIVVVGLLGVGVVRTVLRRRGARRDAAQTDAAGPDDAA